MKSQITNKKIWLSAAIGFALLILFTQPQTAVAQQWTTNGNHISNTNSGNVGIGTGTNSPGAKLEVLSSGTARVLLGDGCVGAGVYGGIGLGIDAFSGCSNYALLGDGVNTFVNAPGNFLFFRVGNVDKMTINGTGVGIGTMFPNLRFHLQAISGNQYPFMMSTSDWVAGSAGSRLLAGFGTDAGNTYSLLQAQTAGASATGNLSLQPFNGNVGIGTVSPDRLLEIREFNTGLQTQLRLFHSNGDAGFNPGSTEIEFLHGGNQLATSKVRLVRTFNGTGSSNTDFYLDLVKGNAGDNGNTTNTVLFAQGRTGNLGIGTVGPTFRLDVQGGQINSSGGLCIAGDCKTAWSQVGGGGPSQWNTNGDNISNANTGNVGIGTAAPGSKLHIVSGTDNPNTLLSLDTGVHGGSQFQIGGTTNNESYFNLNVYRAGLYFNRLSVNNFGHLLLQPGGDSNVGIGTSGPSYRLDVQGGQVNASGGLCIAGDCKTAWSQVGGSSQWITSGSSVYYSIGNVGIGTDSPASKLFVGSGTPAGGTLPGLNVALAGNSYVSASNGTINTFVGADTSSYGIVGTLSNHALGLRANNTLAMTVLPNGNVGVGTASPAAKLDVAGDLNATGTITGGNIVAKYQDVAEWVPASEQIAAGTVVVLDSTKSNQVISSTQSYDTRVAGVISERPGIALGESGGNKVLVATTGRVRIKVDATRGPIRIGDLLVTSDVSGMAMKSEPINIGGVQIHRPGTLIGKALEPLAKGQGEILVLLSLQ